MNVELRLLAECDYADLVQVCENLRERDKAEIFALRWTDDPHQLAEDTWRLRNFAWLAYYKGEPVAVMGAVLVTPRVWSIFAYGTDSWPKVVLALTRHGRRFVRPCFENSGALRAHCYSLETHHDARKWLQVLGLHEEARHKNYGKAGETFVVYAWHPDSTKRTTA